MENNYQNPPATTPPQPSTQPPTQPSVTPGELPANETPQSPTPPAFKYTKATPPQPKNSAGRTVLALLGLAIFFLLGMAGVLISQRQYVSQELVAPNAPESQPAAFIETASCTLTFNVNPTPTPTPEPNECGYSPCETDSDCEEDLVCVTAADDKGYCSIEEFTEACEDNPSVETCCNEPTPTPTPTPKLLECGETPCEDNFDCADDLICVTADNGNNYCAKSAYRVACEDNPTVTRCCYAPGTTPTPTPTPTPSIIITTSGQPDLPEELPVSGPEDWLIYLQGGLAVLGVGALLLLLL